MSSKGVIYFILAFICILQSYLVEAGVYCGGLYCAGRFWFIWFIGLMFIISCVICLRRRRIARRTYVRVGEPIRPVYGTVPTNQYTAPPPPAYGTVVPNAPYPETTAAYPQYYHAPETTRLPVI
ncbi:hypothetical protein KUTeg_004375 [Tegillarca granosa]|uniref:Vesicular, overexpressed in cancer, prosurvival protein 1 n=1 Tax=Tegillarca granosa TaxID=220873 RepID=A0ABQ9FPU5_TEGGR|nr:hypothetical protein KUTeg_004375 [Tegillarca granosa]